MIVHPVRDTDDVILELLKAAWGYSRRADRLEEAGIAFSVSGEEHPVHIEDTCFDSALDLLGVPADNTVTTLDEVQAGRMTPEEVFCRDWLFDIWGDLITSEDIITFIASVKTWIGLGGTDEATAEFLAARPTIVRES